MVEKSHCIGMNYYVNFLGHSMDNGFIFKKKEIYIKEREISWGPFRIYQLLIITANSALFECNWAELAVLISH